MKRESILLLLLIPIVTVACVPFSAKYSADLPKPRVFPEVSGEPSIRLLVYNKDFKPEKVARSLERARKKFPYLAGAAENTPYPDYTIGLEVGTQWEESDFNYVAGLMLGFLPSFYSHEVSVFATLDGDDGQRLGSFHASGTTKLVSQNHLVVILPLTGPLIPAVQKKVWNNTFRDVFIQVGEAIEADRERDPIEE
jgi:hypothetical protein